MERRISDLEAIIKKAKVVYITGINNTVVLGSRVVVLDKEYDEWVEYCIVDSSEVDSLHNRISVESPIFHLCH